mgnify:CR=1 FL=1
MTAPEPPVAKPETDAGRGEHAASAADKQKIGLLAVVKSTLAAATGVQSTKNRERDFTHGNIKVYVAAGIIFTLLFIGTVMAAVKLVMLLSNR